MGLLDFNNPEVLQALQLFATPKGGLLGTLGQIGQQNDQRQERALREEMQRQLMEQRRMEMEQQRRAMGVQQQKDALAQRAFAPNQNLVQNDDEGNAMPSSGGGGFAEYGQGMMQIDPMKGLGIQSQLAQMNAKERVKVGAGETVGHWEGNRFIPAYSAPDKPPAGFTRGPNGLVADPSYLEAQMKIRAAGRPQVNVDTRQETEFAKSLGKQQGEDYSKLMNADAMANGTLNKLSRLESLFASSGNTGKLTPPAMELKAIADSLGFKVDPKLPYQQAAQALSNEIALEMRNPSGGAGMPGALSDRDREFLTNMVPNLAKTPEGNKLLIESKKKLAQRDKEVAKLAREYKARTGRFDEGFYQVLSEYSEKHPLFPQAPQADPIDALVNKYRTR